MERREFLSVSAPMMAGVLSGCLGSSSSCADEDRWPPTVAVPDLVLPPDGLDVLDIQAPGITAFQFDGQLYQCGKSDAQVRFGDVETTPDIDAQMDSCPPIWTWEDCSSVTVHAPVHVAEDAPPGEYAFGFRIMESIGERQSQHYEGSVTVAED